MGLIALAAVAAYHNSLAGPFIFDEHNWIIDNVFIRHLWPIGQVLFPPSDTPASGRPMLSLTLAVNYAFGGLNVWGYHVTNLAIHLLAAWTLFGITRRTLVLPILREQFASVATPLALIVAAIWMVHPLQTEAVTYVIQRTESLAGLLYLLTLYCVIRGATSGKANRWYVAAAMACAVGMATKEILATAPLMVLLYDRTFLAGSFPSAWRQRRDLYLALAASWGLVLILLLSTGFYGGTTGFAVQKFTGWSYLLTQSGVIVYYLQLAFWPAGLCLDYNWPAAQTVGQIVVPGMIVLGLLGLTLWALVKRPAWGFLGAWFFVILAPTSSFIPIRDAAFEHRMYLSLAALAAGLVMGGWLAGQWLVRRGTIALSTMTFAGGFLALLVVVALGTVTFQRNLDYQSDFAIWQDTAAKAPGNERARNNLGLAWYARGRRDEAIPEFRAALKIEPGYAEAHCNLGAVLAEAGQTDEAIEHFRKAIDIEPGYAKAYYNLGSVLADRKRTAEAIDLFQSALKFKPDYAEAHNNLAVALAGCGRFDEAIDHYRAILAMAPESVDTHNNLGVALAGRGRLDDAVAEYQQALRLRPDYLDAHLNLGVALARQGRRDDAAVHFRRVLEIQPDSAVAHNCLGMVLLEGRQFDEAIVHFRKAIELQPDYADARRNLAAALGKKPAK